MENCLFFFSGNKSSFVLLPSTIYSNEVLFCLNQFEVVKYSVVWFWTCEAPRFGKFGLWWVASQGAWHMLDQLVYVLNRPYKHFMSFSFEHIFWRQKYVVQTWNLWDFL